MPRRCVAALGCVLVARAIQLSTPGTCLSPECFVLMEVAVSDAFPVGKLPAEFLATLLARAPVNDARVVLGPAVGLDCAVLDVGNPDSYLVVKSDPITFATDTAGHYLVQVNANDIATTGATPRWLLMTLLLPEGSTTPDLVDQLAGEVFDACRTLGIAVVGGHTEITHGLSRPILSATLLGEVARERLVTPRGAVPGDALLLTKGVPIEGTALLAREFPERLRDVLSAAELAEAQALLTHPGISVVADARVALAAGRVTAMHDPTEGGLAAALWELAEASGRRLVVDDAAVPIPPLAARVCAAFGLDPLATIASGALLLATNAEDATAVCAALAAAGIPCRWIGHVVAGETAVVSPDGTPWPRPARDEIAKAYA